jgi:Nucleotidyl transferase AbiEii toxin, Type IV TA system
MKPKPPRNIAASHRAKLLNLAQERGEGFQFFLGRWVSERFLFRLGLSAHRDQFILKGAMMFVAWDRKLHRPTQDVDLLGYGSPKSARSLSAFGRSARSRLTMVSSSILKA